MHVRPPGHLGSIPSWSRELQGIFPWLIIHTLRGERRQVVTSPLREYEEYEAIQVPHDQKWPLVLTSKSSKNLAVLVDGVTSRENEEHNSESVSTLGQGLPQNYQSDLTWN